MNIIVLSILGALCALLAAHPKYPDGIFGRSALGVVVLVCVVMVIGEARERVSYDLSGGILVMLGALDFFLGRHAYRFLLWAHFGKHAWSAPRRDAELEGQRRTA